RERRSVDELQHQGLDATGLLEAVDLGDVQMVQRGEYASLTTEPRQPIGIGRERRRQDLQRDVTIELQIARAIDLAHAAGAELRGDLIGAEASTRSERHETGEL